MVSGFAKLRRGILEHLADGRITIEEYAVYTVVILKASYRTGYWVGGSLALSKQVRKSERWCRYKMASLREKGYIEATPPNGRGEYAIRVVKYFDKRHAGATSTQEAARWCRKSGQKRHAGATSFAQDQSSQGATAAEEVIQEATLKKNTAQKRRGHSPELVRQIEAKAKRLSKERDGYTEAQVGRNWISDGLELERQVRLLAAAKSL